MIGPNGSGKSTAFNVITGSLRCDGGTVVFKGEDITGLRPHQICHKGIAKTFQVVKPFAHLSALENVLVGRLFGVRGSKRADQTLAEAKEVLSQVGLAGKSETMVESFTIVERKWLEVARALATRPRDCFSSTSSWPGWVRVRYSWRSIW